MLGALLGGSEAGIAGRTFELSGAAEVTEVACQGDQGLAPLPTVRAGQVVSLQPVSNQCLT